MKTVLCGLLGAIIGFVGVGFAASAVLVSALGNREGSASMAGTFFFGPIGALAGALLGMGLVKRFGGGSPGSGKGLMIAAAVVTALGGIALAITASPDRRPSYSYVIEFQLQVPAAALAGVDIPSTNAMWGSASEDLDDKPISQFFDKKCEGETSSSAVRSLPLAR